MTSDDTGAPRVPWTWLVAALVAPLLWPILTGRIFTGDDLPNFNLPIRALYQEALRSGDSILWTPSLFSGFFVFGDGQGGLAHPFHVLLYRYLPLTAAFGIEIAASYVAALAGARLLLRRLGCSRDAAWLGAVAFAFSGFNLLHLGHMNAVAIVAHVPWVLLATHVVMTTEDRRRQAWAGAALAVLVGSELLLGYPHYVWMTVVADAALAIGLVGGGAPVGRAALAAAFGACGVMIGGVQLAATWNMLQTSVRADPSLAFRLTGSLSPWNLLQLWSPFVFAHRIYASADEFLVNEFGLYDGAVCTIALVWVAIRWRGLPHRRLAAGLLALGGVGLVLALGRYGGLYPILARLPIVSTLRVPARHIVLVHLSLAGLAAIMFDDLRLIVGQRARVSWSRLSPLIVLAALSVLTSAVGVSLAGSSWAASRFMLFSGPLRAGLGSAIVLTGVGLTIAAARGRRWAIVLLAVFVAADLGAWGYGYVFQTPLRSIEAIAATANVPPAARPGEYVSPPANLFEANRGVLRGLRLSAGYAGLIPASVLNMADATTLRIAGVRWQWSNRAWTPVPDPLPRARLVSDVRVSEDIARDVHAIDPATTALVDRAISFTPAADGTARVESDRPGRIVVATTARSDQLLVLTERFHDGWQARADNQTVPTVRVYGDFLGCVVPAGRHEVTLRFAPASVSRGLAVSVLGALVTLLAAVAVARRR